MHTEEKVKQIHRTMASKRGKLKGKTKSTLECLYINLDGKGCHDEARRSELFCSVITHNHDHRFIWMRFKCDHNVDKLSKNMREISQTISCSLGCLQA